VQQYVKLKNGKKSTPSMEKKNKHIYKILILLAMLGLISITQIKKIGK